MESPGDLIGPEEDESNDDGQPDAQAFMVGLYRWMNLKPLTRGLER